MERDNLQKLFDNLNGEFDIENPNTGHEIRFLAKLKGEASKTVNLKYTKSNFWKPFMAVAASVILCVSILTFIQKKPVVYDLANVSPELSKTQEFFTTAINQELASLNNERNPETDAIINDALKRIDLLEKEYEKLKIDLTDSGEDKRVIYAMISNFQNRIDLLQSVMKQIEEVKQLNTNYNENNLTI